jgi:hypothetical protein
MTGICRQRANVGYGKPKLGGTEALTAANRDIRRLGAERYERLQLRLPRLKPRYARA